MGERERERGREKEREGDRERQRVTERGIEQHFCKKKSATENLKIKLRGSCTAEIKCYDFSIISYFT